MKKLNKDIKDENKNNLITLSDFTSIAREF